MIFEKGLTQFLNGDTAFAAVFARRVYGLIAPSQAGLPRVVYTKVGDQNSQTLCGTDGTVRVTYQIDIYAASYFEVKDSALIVKQTLVDFRGFMGSTRVKSVTLETDLDVVDPEPGLLRVQQTYNLWIVE